MTIDKLKEFGADIDEGLARCMNNEDFYLKMVGMGLADERFDTLEEVFRADNMEEAFELAHALKGVLGNLALTPIYEQMDEVTELLRAKDENADYAGYARKIKALRDELLAM